MFYEEKIINGKLFSRTTPTGEWRLVKGIKADAIHALVLLTDEQRLSVFKHFCKHCGSNNPKCQTSIDEPGAHMEIAPIGKKIKFKDFHFAACSSGDAQEALSNAANTANEWLYENDFTVLNIETLMSSVVTMIYGIRVWYIA